ncbi:MAG: hypothetical protein UX92_C0009G0024 [Candidatus Amesbacteria bacterium GW2011_GWA1_47_20]|uniref:DUF5666 domain-containing protein n=2 Tax=Candidatus Amesiibacteriota TaxID=1752730 RepID=A0A0G1SJZ2_9BACT|nr:MAG: hypothetical protein UX42_C0004G0038 [Microgenomates group bacterium GW2011_GWC1_46_20]KKU69814.1 MAG: hypothetical protein UX92_C0009G0024 [Candidatus Amesbacteria bacterium GW2011_GWA1_47_20]KKU84011.1 MAG: hypothetical protein UY11_C0008G0024 [Candidatus Amesbacteria bacterium GW2011_GWC2_47_8]
MLSLLLTATLLAQAPTATDSAIRQAVKDQVDAIKTAVARRAFVGPISAKSEASITITNLANQTRTAVVAGDATIKLTGGKEGTFADLKVGDFVIAMGDIDSQGTLAVKRLLIIAKPTPDKRVVVSGRVTDLSTSDLTVETAAKEVWTVKLQAATSYAGKIKKSDIKVGDRIVTVGTTSTALNLTAKLIVQLSTSPTASPSTP